MKNNHQQGLILGNIISLFFLCFRVLIVRSKFYELLANCIPPQIIFEKLTECLMNRIDDSLRQKLVKWAAYHEHRMHCGSKPIIHLEAFVAKFMAEFKSFMVQIYG